MMKKFLLGTVALVAFATSASAADLAARPRPAPPPYIEPMYNWSGFYMGINGGWGQSRNEYEWTGPLGWAAYEYGAHATGGTFGGQIGFNMQAGSWVFGLEAQGNWADFNKSYYGGVNDPWSVGTKVDALGLFTGRIGYAANNALFYVKGGAAVASNESWAAWDGVTYARASDTRWGAAVGAGLEYAFTPNWSFGVEYMHAWLGDNDYAWSHTHHDHNWNNLNVHQDIDLVTLRLNYKFGGVGKNPVVARY